MRSNMQANPTPPSNGVSTQRIFRRFTSGQRWEHALLILSFTILLITGLPQKYFATWGHQILTTPESVVTFRQIHRIAAIGLTLEVIYHLVSGIWLLVRRKLSAEMFPTWKDVRDAGQMLRYLFFLTDKKPAFGKYTFEQKFTYWFLFLGIGIMVVTGFILWFPIIVTKIFPGGVIPAAKLAHSTEAIVAGWFILIWHFYHVHIERLNLSIFTGWLNEHDMRTHHAQEYQRQIAMMEVPAATEETRPADLQASPPGAIDQNSPHPNPGGSE